MTAECFLVSDDRTLGCLSEFRRRHYERLGRADLVERDRIMLTRSASTDGPSYFALSDRDVLVGTCAVLMHRNLESMDRHVRDRLTGSDGPAICAEVGMMVIAPGALTLAYYGQLFRSVAGWARTAHACEFWYARARTRVSALYVRSGGRIVGRYRDQSPDGSLNIVFGSIVEYLEGRN